MKKALFGAGIVVLIAAVGEAIYIKGFGGDTDFAVTIACAVIAVVVAVSRSLLAKKALFSALGEKDDEAALQLLGES